MERGLSHFTRGISDIFVRMARALKPGAPLAFTYHHNAIEAYHPMVVALLDAGLVCSATIPCPAEMGASIHISGTASSVVDTVLVCRSTGLVDRRTIVFTPLEIAGLVEADLDQLRRGGVRVTQGDTRCVAYGHIARLAVWTLRASWDRGASVERKLERVAEAVVALGGTKAVEECLRPKLPDAPLSYHALIREQAADYEASSDEIPF